MLTALPHPDSFLEQLEFPKILEKVREYRATPYSDDKLQAWQPLSHPDAVSRSLQEVAEMMALLQAGYPIPLHHMPDIRPLLEAIKPENSYLEGEGLLKMKEFLESGSTITRFFKEHRAEASRLYEYARGIHGHAPIVREIKSTISVNGEVVDSASSPLKAIRTQIRELEAEQKKVLLRVLRRYSEFSQDDIVTLRDGRMVLGIQQQYVKKINGVVHGTSATGATVFIEPMETLKISNQVQRLRIEERTEVIRILRNLTDRIRDVHLDIWYGIENIAMLDFIYARARLSVGLNASVPRLVTDDSRLKIIEGRHPLLILKTGLQNVVPLSLEMGRGFRTLVITGPNAGGKTVALKTIGLLVLMTRMGLPIPAGPDSEIPFIPQILVDIGERQSIEQDLSTFSAHIIRLADIIERADESSLILIDEIGTGTDPREGAALAIAVLSRLTESGALTVATTHHGELKAFAHTTPRVENASMEFDLDTLQPTYQLRVGIPGSSYAFEIARRYGLPDAIIQKAQSIVGQEKGVLEELIISLEKKIQLLEKEHRELSIKLSEAEALRNLYQRQLEQMQRQKQNLKQQAAREAEEIIFGAKKTLEALVAEIRSQQASKAAIRKSREVLEQEAKTIRKILKETRSESPGTFHPQKGDKVWVRSLRELGEVLEAPDEKDKVRVLVRNKKLLLDREELQLPAPAGKTSEHISRSSGEAIDALSEGVKPELDLRGKDSWEAIEATRAFLDQALQAGWDEVRIIHGKGKGILREKINQFLARDKRVLEKRPGKWGEGDVGVTIVKLRKDQTDNAESNP